MAKPSAMAVLPTPGSPTNIGLFLLLLDKICKVRLISSSRPITGSNLPCLAISIKFLAYLFNALKGVSEVWEETVEPFFNSFVAVINPFSVRPASFKILAVLSFCCNMAINKCSGATNSSLNCFNTLEERSNTLFISLLTFCAGSPPATFASFVILSTNFVSTKLMLTLFFFSKNSIAESASSNNDCSKCSVSIFTLLLLNANCCACCILSCDFMVKFCKLIPICPLKEDFF